MVKNDIDSLVSLRLDKSFLHIEHDIYLAVTYIAPENSPIHNMDNIDVFRQIENDINLYRDLGQIIVTGDTNFRVGHKKDYIDCDRTLTSDDIYDIDIPLPRTSCHFTSNRFGDCLVDLSKSSNIHIVNGRLYQDKTIGKFTCMTYNGENVVHYLLIIM